jgi:hypothetical protein
MIGIQQWAGLIPLIALVCPCLTAQGFEPYPKLSGGAFSGAKVAESPDPLVAYRWRDVRAGDGLQAYTLRPRRVRVETAGAFVTGAAGTIAVRGTGSIRFDFGVESAGWLEFDSPDLAGEVEMSIGEYNRPAVVNQGPRHPAKTAAPASHGTTYRLELNRELYEGVRFGWIHVRKFTRPWHITAVRLVCQTKPVNYDGSFRASDPMLTRIWYTGAYAVKLNLLKDYFGAILMDRGDRISWTGDAHPAQAAALVAFGNWDFIKANLERTAQLDNGIENYALYWVLSLVDYYRYTGDGAALDRMAPIARRKMARAEAIWDDPPMQFFGWDERLGAGFEEPNIGESKNAYRLLAIRAGRELAWALAARGRKSDAAELEALATRWSRRIENRPGTWETAGLHVAAEAVTAGLGEAARAVWEREFRDPLNRLSYSPFNQYFVLQAMAKVGMHEEALAIVRELWGGQIQYGGTCFFEVFRPSWNRFLQPNDAVPNCQAGYTSLCHPWSSGVTKWLTEETLGIRPVEPGFVRWEVAPHLGSTLTRVEGKTPTPHGALSVEFDAVRGVMVVTAPAGTAGVIGVPKQGRRIRSIESGGRVAWAREDAEFVYITDVKPGRHEYRIRYEGVLEPPVKIAEAAYPARRVDVAVHGSEGSVRFGAGKDGGDDLRLPGYVEKIAHRSARKGVGYLMTGNPEATQQTMTVDVTLKGEHEYRLALYFLDSDRQQRRMAVELFDLDTRKLIAPVELVEDFAGGKYLVYEYDRSCRIRLDHVSGGDAVINGIYFDAPGAK